MIISIYAIFIRFYEIFIRFYEILIRNYEILIRFYKILFKAIVSLTKNLLISQKGHLQAWISLAIISRMILKLLYLTEQAF
jgi:hypothetical protein